MSTRQHNHKIGVCINIFISFKKSLCRLEYFLAFRKNKKRLDLLRRIRTFSRDRHHNLYFGGNQLIRISSSGTNFIVPYLDGSIRIAAQRRHHRILPVFITCSPKLKILNAVIGQNLGPWFPAISINPYRLDPTVWLSARPREHSFVTKTATWCLLYSIHRILSWYRQSFPELTDLSDVVFSNNIFKPIFLENKIWFFRVYSMNFYTYDIYECFRKWCKSTLYGEYYIFILKNVSIFFYHASHFYNYINAWFILSSLL